MEEDWCLPMATLADGVRAISLAGARILARRLRNSVTLQQQRALLRATTDQSCPFDLHRLLPVPPAILRLEPEDPQSRGWLWRHWGTTRALRYIRLLPSPADRRNRHTDYWLVEFWGVQARAEATIGRFKPVTGDGLRCRTDQRWATEVDVAVHTLNRRLELGRPTSVRFALARLGLGLLRSPYPSYNTACAVVA